MASRSQRANREQGGAKSQKLRRASRSERDAPPQRCCDVHPAVRLRGDDASCPQCAIEVMKSAAQTLERRAAELERQERERRRTAQQRSRKEQQPSKRRPRRGTAAMSIESASECLSRQRSKKAGSPPAPRRTSRRFSVGQVAPPCQMDERSRSNSAAALIKIARLREGEGSRGVWSYATLKGREKSPDVHLVFTVEIDGAIEKYPVTQWAKSVRMVAERNDAADAEGEEEADSDIMMTSCLQLNEARPADKRKPNSQDEEGEIDFMLSDRQLWESCPAGKLGANRNRRKSGEEQEIDFMMSDLQLGEHPTEEELTKPQDMEREDEEQSHVAMSDLPPRASQNSDRKWTSRDSTEDVAGLEKSLHTVATQSSHGSNETYPSTSSSSRGGYPQQFEDVLVPDQISHKLRRQDSSSALTLDHDMSMYTLGLHEEPSRPGRESRPQKFEDVPVTDQISHKLRRQNSSRALTLYDDVSMYTLGFPEEPSRPGRDQSMCTRGPHKKSSRPVARDVPATTEDPRRRVSFHALDAREHSATGALPSASSFREGDAAADAGTGDAARTDGPRLRERGERRTAPARPSRRSRQGARAQGDPRKEGTVRTQQRPCGNRDDHGHHETSDSLTTGNATAQDHRQVRQNSFCSALKSIHR